MDERDEDILTNEEEIENSPASESEEPIDNINDQASDEIEMVEPGSAVGLADLAALKKMKLVVIIIISVLAFIMIGVFFVVVLNEMNTRRYDYISPKCENVTVHFSHRNTSDITMDVETYVANMVYSLTKDMKTPNRRLYQAIAVMVRTELQASSECSVTFEDEANDYYTFHELKEDNSRYTEIIKAVENVRGLVMVENNQYVSVSFDSFCYSSSDEYYYLPAGIDNEHLPTSGWVKDEVSPSFFRKCPCRPDLRPTKSIPEENSECWVKENYPKKNDDGEEDPYYLYYDGGSDGKGFSTYAAYYMAKDLGYNDIRILKVFYPSDWEFQTIFEEDAKEIQNGVINCSYINFDKTSLSRDEFVSLATSYLSSKSSETAKRFRDNAGRIYDLGIEVGANPEMVYIVAEKEQGWKDTSFTTRCNNFYGMGVTNGNSTGKCYDSFEDGVVDILKYVKRKGDLTSFTKVYSYLGTFLANPGSAGDGGCYYLTLNDIYGKNYSRCNSSYKCASSNGGPGCVKTTEAEKQAYIDWQSKKILKIRSNIFHLDSENCTLNSIGNVSLGEAGSVDSSDRMKWLFPSGIPKTKEQINAYLTTIQVPVVNVSGNKSTISLTVHSKLANEIKAIFEEMVEIGFPVNSAGGYAYRLMASGTGSLSHHSYGVAIDINASANPAVYQSTHINKDSPYYITNKVVSIWKKHGFYWGGDWSGKYYDPMHFTYTNH